MDLLAILSPFSFLQHRLESVRQLQKAIRDRFLLDLKKDRCDLPIDSERVVRTLRTFLRVVRYRRHSHFRSDFYSRHVPIWRCRRKVQAFIAGSACRSAPLREQLLRVTVSGRLSS